MKFPVIDYRAHPAFRQFATPYAYDDELIAGHIRAIDSVHLRVGGSVPAARDQVEQALAEIATHVHAIKQHSIEVKAPIVAREWLGAAMDWVISELRYEYLRLVFSRSNFDGSGLDRTGQAHLAEMRARGFFLVDLDEREFEQIRRLVLERVPELRGQLEQRPTARAVYSPSRVSPLGRAIDRALSKAGVLDVLSQYKRNPMRILGTGVELSRPMQKWHSDIYSDCGLADGPLRYLHVDETDHTPKAMIYATPVTPENGPTGIIPESNCWERSEFRFRVYKGIDKITIARYGGYVAGAEYRVAARDPELRRIFMQLPVAFQGSSHFGDDVLPDSALAGEIAPREFKFLSAGKGQALVFDGARTLHRGSIVDNGERMALQVGFKNINDDQVKRAADGGGPLGKFLKKASKLARMAVRG